MAPNDVAALIDHAILQPAISIDQMKENLDQVRSFPLAPICIPSFAVSMAVRHIEGANIPIGAVVGFPHGGEIVETKVDEAVRAIEHGAADIDFVVNPRFVLSEVWADVTREIEMLSDACHRRGAIVKVIFENAYLNDELKIKLCQICSAIGADFVKTSTGFATVKDMPSGATELDVRLMRQHTAPEIGVKASGGIRDLDQLGRLVAAGANRIGTAATLAILQEAAIRE